MLIMMTVMFISTMMITAGQGTCDGNVDDHWDDFDGDDDDFDDDDDGGNSL